jgi:hypothetical protein
VIFVSFTLSLAGPVHEESVRQVDGEDGYQHVAGDAKRRDSSKQANDQAEASEELRQDREIGEGRGNSPVNEVLCGGRKTRSSEPAQRHIAAVRQEHHPQHEPQQQLHSIVVRR